MSQSVHILVVEDSLLVAMSLESALAEVGYAVTVADSNASARAAARSAESQCAFDAALVDFHLPDGDSAALCSELSAAGTRVALVTGIDRSSAEPLSGFDRIFYKPIEEPAMMAWLEGVSRRMPGEGGRAGRSSS